MFMVSSKYLKVDFIHATTGHWDHVVSIHERLTQRICQVEKNKKERGRSRGFTDGGTPNTQQPNSN